MICMIGTKFVDQVSTSYATQALFDMLTLLRFVPEEILTLGLFLLWCLGTLDRLQRVGIIACIPGLSRDRHGCWGEVLHLFELEVKALGQYCQFCHVRLRTSRVAGDEVGDELLTQALLTTDAVEKALKVVEL